MPISFWGLDIGKSLMKRYWPDDAFQKQQLLNAYYSRFGCYEFLQTESCTGTRTTRGVTANYCRQWRHWREFVVAL